MYDPFFQEIYIYIILGSIAEIKRYTSDILEMKLLTAVSVSVSSLGLLLLSIIATLDRCPYNETMRERESPPSSILVFSITRQTAGE